LIAGFGYEFNSLRNEDENELAMAFKRIFGSGKDLTTMMLVKASASYLFGIVSLIKHPEAPV
jgi:hypothetical protein